MSIIEIREAISDDYQSLYELNRDEMGYDYPLDKTKEKLLRLLQSSSDKIFVAVDGGKVIGYIHVNDYDTLYAPHFKNVMGIAVSAEYKRKGVGRALISKAEEWARESGAEGIRLVSGSSRTGAHEFYRRCGYEGGKTQLNFKKLF